MKKTFAFLLTSLGISIFVWAQHDKKMEVVATYSIKSSGWWDYIAVNEGKIYVSHGTQVNILNEKTGDSTGIVVNTNGVHGIAFDNALGKGYTSNGRSNTVSVFNLKTNATDKQIAVGKNPDAIMFDPYSKTIITCNGTSKDMSVIDAKSGKVIATVPLGGKPETAVSDNAGKIFVNIEDKNEIAVVSAKTWKVEKRWPFAPGVGPTGLDIDNITKRLFVGCDKLLIILDATNGKLVDKHPTGDGCDGVVFDPKRKMVYTSNGEGTITAVKELSANSFKVFDTIKTKRGARTIAINAKNGDLFLPTADFEPATSDKERPKMKPGSFQILVVR
ncbi:MAG: hypothetical protein NVS1B13_17160 [Flavisolibacter sp.]